MSVRESDNSAQRDLFRPISESIIWNACSRIVCHQGRLTVPEPEDAGLEHPIAQRAICRRSLSRSWRRRERDRGTATTDSALTGTNLRLILHKSNGLRRIFTDRAYPPRSGAWPTRKLHRCGGRRLLVRSK